MRRIFKSRWFLLALLPIVLFVGWLVWVLSFSGSSHINQATFRELKMGMTYDEAHVLLGGRIHNVQPMTDSDGNTRFKYGYSEDHESVFPPGPTIWFTVDGSNRLDSKQFEGPDAKMILDRLIAKIKVATGLSPAPPPPLPPMPLPGAGR